MITSKNFLYELHIKLSLYIHWVDYINTVSHVWALPVPFLQMGNTCYCENTVLLI